MKNFIGGIKYFLFLTFVSLFFVGPVYAAYNWYIPITINNNSTLTHTNVPLLVSMDNAQLSTYTYLTSGRLDSAFGATGNEYPLFLPTTRTAFLIPTLYAGKSMALNYFLGFSPVRPWHSIIFGNNGFITTADSPTLEPAATSLNMNVTGYINTTSTQLNSFSLWEKANEYGLSTKWGGVAFWFCEAAAFTYELVTGNSLPLNLTPVGAATNWDCVNDVGGAPDDDTTYVSSASAGPNYLEDVYTATPSVVIGCKSSKINTVSVFYRARGYGVVDASAMVGVSLDGVTIWSAGQTLTGAYVNYTVALTRPGGGTWTLAEVERAKIHLKLHKGTGGVGADARCTQMYITVSYYLCSEIWRPVTSGNMTISATGVPGTSISLTVNGTTNNTAVGCLPAPVSPIWDSTSTLVMGNAVRSSDLASVVINGVTALKYQPITQPYADVVADLSGNGNTGIITWGTNPANVDVSLGNIFPCTLFVPPGGAEGEPAEMMIPPATGTGALIPMTGNTSATGANLPVFDVFTRGATSLGWSVVVLYGVMMFVTSIAIGAGFLVATSSLTWGVVGMGSTLGLAASTGIFGFWAPIIIGLICIMLLVVVRGL